jgi:O-antigen ligase
MSRRGRRRPRNTSRPPTRPRVNRGAPRPAARSRHPAYRELPGWASIPVRLGLQGWSLLLLLVVPAVIVPGALNRFVFGKLAIAAIGAGLAFLTAPRGRMARPAAVLLGAGAVVLLVAALLSRSPLTALLGREQQQEGVLVLAVYVLAAVSGARLLGPDRTDSTLDVAWTVMSLTAIAVMVLAVSESFGLRPLSANVARPGSLLGNASDEGAFAVLYAGPLLIHALSSRRWLSAAGAASAVLTVILSGSRGALLGLLVTIVVVALVMGWRSKWVIGGGLVAVAALVLAIPATRNRVLELSPLSRQTVTGRRLLWDETINLASHHPLLGVGPSQFENAIVGQHTLQWEKTIGPAYPPSSPHDLILQTLMAGGVILLIGAVGLALLTARSGVQAIRGGSDWWAIGVAAGLAGYGTALLFHFTSPGTTIPAALMGGSLLASPLASSGAPRDGWYRRVVPAGCAALAVCFVCGAVAQIWLRLGDDAAGQGRLAAANSDFQLARDLLPWDPDLPGQVFHQFVASALAGDTSAAPYAREWEHRAGAVAGDEQVTENQATLLEVTGDFTASERLVSAQLHTDPYNPMFLVLQGVDEASLHNYSEAQASLVEATTIDPTDPDPWQDLALVYKARGMTALSDRAQATAERLRAAAGAK